MTVKIFQAFLIAFTSDFIQKIVYKYEYGEDGKMDNYVMFTLSKSPEKNWIDSGQVRLIFFIKILFLPILSSCRSKLATESDSVLYLLVCKSWV